MVYQMTRIATGSLFLVSLSFLSNFRICKDNVNCIPDRKPWPCFDLVLSYLILSGYNCHTYAFFYSWANVLSTSSYNWQKRFKLLDLHRSLLHITVRVSDHVRLVVDDDSHSIYLCSLTWYFWHQVLTWI